MLEVNFLAVLAATVAAFLLGWLWYSKFGFGKPWARAQGKDLEQCAEHPHGHWVLVIAFLAMFIAAYFFALAIGPDASTSYAVVLGLIISACWISTSFAIQYLFTNKGIKLFLIDSGYHIVCFILYGLIIGSWH